MKRITITRCGESVRPREPCFKYAFMLSVIPAHAGISSHLDVASSRSDRDGGLMSLICPLSLAPQDF